MQLKHLHQIIPLANLFAQSLQVIPWEHLGLQGIFRARDAPEGPSTVLTVIPRSSSALTTYDQRLIHLKVSSCDPGLKSVWTPGEVHNGSCVQVRYDIGSSAPSIATEAISVFVIGLVKNDTLLEASI
nr:hypothetical protein CFP56_69477 [Quercus suber]